MRAPIEDTQLEITGADDGLVIGAVLVVAAAVAGRSTLHSTRKPEASAGNGGDLTCIGSSTTWTAAGRQTTSQYDQDSSQRMRRYQVGSGCNIVYGELRA